MSAGALIVVAPGAQLLVQDAGRPGFGAIGVSASGAADQAAYRAANRLVGNRPGSAALEALAAGAMLRAEGAQVIAVTGAAESVLVHRAGGDTRSEPSWTLIALGDGDVLELPRASTLRRVVAVRGGVEVPPVLGSRSRDTLAAIGPEALVAGDRMPVGDAAGDWPAISFIVPPAIADAPLPLLPGPRRDRLVDERALFGRQWRVSPASNRTALRLEAAEAPPGVPLPNADAHGLASEGMVPGALQVPPSGEPILLLVDHPVTGGYPVPFVLASAALSRAAQLAPGASVRFVLG
ncbi:MAG: biotin-dependent carboxyltransferase family protein [Microbacterium sp.]|nr:biotin-dependent carboxyltransferase family protein [Microbacterium sp.]